MMPSMEFLVDPVVACKGRYDFAIFESESDAGSFSAAESNSLGKVSKLKKPRRYAVGCSDRASGRRFPVFFS